MKARTNFVAADPLETARAAWGEALPDWVRVLAEQCKRSSQAAVARDLGRTGAVISQVIRNCYPAGTARIEERVRGVFMAGTVECPAMGPLELHHCQDWREMAATFAHGNPLRTRMFRACLACPRMQKEPEE